MEKILFFAEVGRTPYSSLASEKLLIENVLSINNYFNSRKVELFLYPIYFYKNFSKWIFCNKDFDHSNYRLLSSTSIKFFRDIYYLIQFLYFYFKTNPKQVFFYNLNDFQLKIIYLLKTIFNLRINLIQADGYIIKKDFCSMFKNIIVFSNIPFEIYDAFKVSKIFLSYPCVASNYREKIRKETFNSPKKFIHSGSISKYNVSEKSLKFLLEICNNDKNIEFIFTSNQKKIPDYFSYFVDNFPMNFKFYGNLSFNKLESLLEQADYALDLRNFDNLKDKSRLCDFPSKLLLYIRKRIIVFSTMSNSINSEFKENLFSIYDLDKINLDNLKIDDNELNKLLEDINQRAINKTIIEIIK